MQTLYIAVQLLPLLQLRPVGSAFEPVASLVQQGFDAGQQLGRASLQRPQCVIQCIDDRQEVDHPAAQFIGVAYGLLAGAFVAQLADHHFQRVEAADHRIAQRADFFRLTGAAYKALTVGRSIAEPFFRGGLKHRCQASGPEHRTHDGGADDAEKNLFCTRHRDVEHRLRVVDHRQRNQRHGVAGQHQGVAVGGAQVQGQKQQGAGPQPDHDGQQQGRLHEHGYQQH